jgi:hypothetical protein
MSGRTDPNEKQRIGPPFDAFGCDLARLVAPLVYLLVMVSAAPASAEIIVSEIMYNPAGTDLDPTATPPYNREWIEIYNAGAETVNLAGWSLGDSQDNQWASPFPARTVLSPNHALIVTGDAATFDSQWGSGINRIEVGSFPSLSNTPSPTNETIALRDSLGAIRDEVNYDDAFGWPRANGSDGQSVFLKPNALSAAGNDVGSNWLPSMWGAYGARFINSGGENHGSPGFVETVSQQPFAPSPDAAWSMAIIPDSQNYVKSTEDRAKFTQMTEWIRDNRDAFNIQVVLHEGDIVNNNNTSNPTSGNQTGTQQWQNAQASMHVLNGEVPYILAAGNHDFGTTNAQDRSTQINTFFKANDNPLVDPAQGGIMKGAMVPGEIQNAYYDFTAPDGRKMLVIALEWEPRPATVAWANQIAALPEYEDHTALLLTHAYLLGNNNRYSGTNVPADADGNELWQNLVRQHGNFEMTFNGHFGGDGEGYLASTANDGNVVQQMFFNTQFETLGGDGWFRLVEFLNDGKTVRIRTYSALHNLERTGPSFLFEFEVSQIELPPALVGDYNGDGVVDAADYVTWRDNLGSTEQLAADGNGDGEVNAADYSVWKENFGRTLDDHGAGQAIASVPEPTTFNLFLTLATLAAIRRSRKMAKACYSIL